MCEGRIRTRVHQGQPDALPTELHRWRYAAPGVGIGTVSTHASVITDASAPARLGVWTKETLANVPNEFSPATLCRGAGECLCVFLEIHGCALSCSWSSFRAGQGSSGPVRPWFGRAKLARLFCRSEPLLLPQSIRGLMLATCILGNTNLRQVQIFTSILLHQTYSICSIERRTRVVPKHCCRDRTSWLAAGPRGLVGLRPLPYKPSDALTHERDQEKREPVFRLIPLQTIQGDHGSST